MDYLAYYFNAMAFCMTVETLLEEEVPQRAQYLRVIHLRAEPDRQPPVLARHDGRSTSARSRCLVGAARARPDPRPVRDVLRPAHAHALLPGRRRDRGHPARLGAEVPGVPRRDARPHRPVRGAARPATRSGCSARENVGVVSEERLLELGVHRAAAARRRQPVGPAQGDALLVLRGLRLQDPGRHASATTTTATASGWPRCASR